MKTNRALNFCFVLGLLALTFCAGGSKSFTTQNISPKPSAGVTQTNRAMVSDLLPK